MARAAFVRGAVVGDEIREIKGGGRSHRSYKNFNFTSE